MQYLRDNAPLTQRFEIDGRHISAIEALVNKFLVRAKTHAAEAHNLKEVSADTEKKIKAAIKTVSTDVLEKK